jgi:threonine/homoserine/homoserine lactone efflux protein
MIGPVFFILLETSIRKGVRAALAFDCGVLLSDLIYIFLAYIFYAEVAKLTSGDNSYLINIFGGVIFVVFGVVTLLKKPKAFDREDAEGITQTNKDYVMLGLKGFLLNFANPAVIFYWFSVIALGAKKGESNGLGESTLLYIVILLLTFFAVDILKIVGAKKLRPFITDRVLTGLNRLTGLIILISGLVLLGGGITKVL